jgi:hypothetical protein
MTLPSRMASIHAINPRWDVRNRPLIAYPEFE